MPDEHAEIDALHEADNNVHRWVSNAPLVAKYTP